MDPVIAGYAGDYPRRSWMKYTMITMLMIWVVSAVVYGVPTWDRAVHVQGYEVISQTTAANNDLWSMVAGLEKPDRTEVGQLASLVIQLRNSPTPQVALASATIYSQQFPRISNVLGFGVLNQIAGTNTSSFSYRFMFQVDEATPNQIVPSHLLKPPYKAPGYGNWNWQALVAGTVSLATSFR